MHVCLRSPLWDVPGRTGFKTTGLLLVKKSKITPPSPNPSLFLLPYRSIAIQLGRSSGHGWVHPAAKLQDLSLLCSARCGFLGCFVLHRGAEAPCHVQELISVLSSCCGAALGTSELVSLALQAAHGPWSPLLLGQGGCKIILQLLQIRACAGGTQKCSQSQNTPRRAGVRVGSGSDFLCRYGEQPSCTRWFSRMSRLLFPDIGKVCVCVFVFKIYRVLTSILSLGAWCQGGMPACCAGSCAMVLSVGQ